jgi:hypothetical protein
MSIMLKSSTILKNEVLRICGMKDHRVLMPNFFLEVLLPFSFFTNFKPYSMDKLMHVLYLFSWIIDFCWPLRGKFSAMVSSFEVTAFHW